MRLYILVDMTFNANHLYFGYWPHRFNLVVVGHFTRVRGTISNRVVWEWMSWWHWERLQVIPMPCRNAVEGKGGHFFETSAVLLSFVLLGKWMNSLAVRRTSRSLDEINEFTIANGYTSDSKEPCTTMKMQTNGTRLKDAYDEEVVDIRLVQPNDTVKVLRGASIPADGVVSHGEMTVDESMVSQWA